MTTAKISEFTNDNIMEIRAAMKEALKSVEERFGIKFQTGNVSYSPENFTMKNVTVVISKDDPFLDGVSPKQQADLVKYFPKAMLQKILFNGKDAIVVGMHGRSTILFKYADDASSLRNHRMYTGNRIYCQLEGIEYDAKYDTTPRK